MEKDQFTITELAQLLNETLDVTVGNIKFNGEINQVTRAQSGHLYFDLKDADSKISAVMWQGMTRALTFDPQPGKSVLCSGRPSFYNRSGRLQMIVTRMEEFGEGLLQKKFLALKAALEKEGLFDESRKRKIPLLPRGIGVITSASGAAIHDMTVKFKERMPNVPVYLIDARVQGEGSSQEIAKAIEEFNRLDIADVLIVGRGGGSLEDLWSFNEEVVVRAIFASRIPVVSAVGHEVDITLSDLVADLRAPTPTAAAELVVPARDQLLKILMELYRRLAHTDRWLQPLVQAIDEASMQLDHSFGRILQQTRLKVETATAKLRNIEPFYRIEQLDQRLSANEKALNEGIKRKLATASQVLQFSERRLDPDSQKRKLDKSIEKLDGLEARSNAAVKRRLERGKEALASKEALLASLNHQRVLERGFALVRLENGQIVNNIDQLEKQKLVSVKVARGGFDAEIKSLKR